MSANLPLIWADKRNSSLLADFIARHGAEYCLTAEEINQMRDAINEMAVVQQSIFMGIAVPSGTPTGTGARFWFSVTAGTYTNFGGVVVAANSLALIAVTAAGVFSVSQTAFVTVKGDIGDTGATGATGSTGPKGDTGTAKIENWIAQQYLSGEQRIHVGILWQANTATLAGDVPGTSPKWVDVLDYASNSVVANKANIVVGKNKFDKSKAVDGFYVGINGTLIALANYSTSDFCPILPNTVYRVSGANNDYRAIYDINKVRIEGSNNNTQNAGYSFTSPTSAAFVRFSLTTASKNTAQLEVGNVATAYETYRERLDPLYNTVDKEETNLINIRTTSLESRTTVIEDDLKSLIPSVQTHISEQNGFMYTNGILDNNSNFKTRIFDLTNIKQVRIQLGTLAASGANAFSFYSATSGFGSSNYISGTSFTAFLAASRDMTLTVPAGAVRLLVCEFNANISTYIVTGFLLESKLDDIIERISSIEANTSNMIVCRGDSITAGTDGAYPTNLQTLLGANFSVINLGAGSAWIQDIAAKQGGVPFLLLNDLVIPSDNTTETTVPPTGVYNKYQSTGTQICAPFNLSASRLEYSPCMIDNEEFIMTLTSANGSPGTVSIRRINAGDAFTIKAGTPIYTNSLKVYKDVLASVFFMGTNNTQSHTLDLPNYTDTIINYHKDCIKLLNNSNYLILGLFNISHRMYNRDLVSSSVTDAQLLAQHVAYELKMDNEFGLQFINLRKYLASPKAIKDAVRLGYMSQVTADTNAANDVIWQNKGCAAYSFMIYQSSNDFVHPNAVGYKMIAWYVHNWMKKYLKVV